MYTRGDLLELQASVGAEPRRGARADGEDRPGGELGSGAWKLPSATPRSMMSTKRSSYWSRSLTTLRRWAAVRLRNSELPMNTSRARAVWKNTCTSIAGPQPLDAVGHHGQPGVELAEEVLHDRRHDRIEQALLRRQVVVQAAHLDPDLAGDGPQAGGLVAVLEEQVDGRRSDQLGGGRLGRRDGIHGHGAHLTNAVVHVTRTAFARELLADCPHE